VATTRFPAETSSPSIFGQHRPIAANDPPSPAFQLTTTRPDLDAPDARSLNSEHPPHSLSFPLLASVSAGLPHPCLHRSRNPPFISLPPARDQHPVRASASSTYSAGSSNSSSISRAKHPSQRFAPVASPASRPFLEPHLHIHIRSRPARLALPLNGFQLVTGPAF